MRYTAPRIVAALCLGLVAMYVSGYVKTLLPEETNFGYFSTVNFCIGALVGWVIMGRNAGRGLSDAISNGLTSTVALVFWALFIQGGNEMLRLALLRRFDGPMEAIVGVFDLMAKFGVYLMNVQVILMLVVGGIVAALITEASSRIWT